MGRFYGGLSVLSGIFVWSVAILRTSDGGSITWHKPPPSETVKDPRVTAKTNATLTKGFLNEELSCDFNLTVDLSVITVTMNFGIAPIVTYASSKLLLDPRFVSRVNATWIPTKLTLIVFNVTTADEGLYSCKVLTAIGTWIRKIQVTVLVSPSITRLSTKTAVEGDSVTLECKAEGNPSPNITWARRSDNYDVAMPLTNIRKQDAGMYSCVSVHSCILPLTNISRHDAGMYRCTADNGVGYLASGDVSVVVQYPPEVNGSVQTATVAEGMKHMFSCPAYGNPEPHIEWYNETGAKISSEKQLEARESGCFTCVANNSLGTPVNVTQCLTIDAYLATVHPSTVSPEQVESTVIARITIERKYPESDVAKWFVEEIDKIYLNMQEYNWTEVTDLRRGSVIVDFILHFKTVVSPERGLENLRVAISSNGTFGDFPAKDLILLSDKRTVSTTLGSHKPTVSAGPPWAIIGAVAGGVVFLAILVCVLTWWVHKQRKCRKDTKIHNSDLGRHDDEGGHSQVQGAYAQSGPPAANGTDGAAEQEVEVAGATPTYAVVDKSKKSKKQGKGKPPEYAVVDKFKKQEAVAIPTYAAVDKSKKKKKKSQIELPPVYAEVDKSKKKQKKIDDKNLYETFDERKKENKPGELLYADLGDFQNTGMPVVTISPQPLSAVKKPDSYERTDYADITQFLKGDATLPPTDGNGDMEMKPERPSKKKMQGKDKETPI